jgi:Mrp family chromosome partitioning ATPase
MRVERDVSQKAVASAWSPPPSSRPEQSALAAYINSIRSHQQLVIVVLLVALGASVAWLVTRGEQYQADAEIFVNPLPQEEVAFLGLPLVRDAGDPTRTIQTAAALVDSSAAARETARRLGGNWTEGGVEGAVTVKPQGQTNILEVSAVAGSPELAARVANTFASSALAVRKRTVQRLARQAIPDVRARLRSMDQGSPGAADLQRLLNRLVALSRGPDPTLAVSQGATPPSVGLAPPASVVVALALLAGAVLGIGAALLIDTLTPGSVDTEDELIDLLPIPVLARLPRLPRRQRRLGSLQVSPAMREALRTVHVQLNLRGQRRRVVMVTSPSPGDGKTTTAVAFGVALAEAGSKVILVDTDVRRAPLHALSGRAPGRTPPASQRASTTATRGSRLSLNALLRPVPGHPNLQLLDGNELAFDSTNEKSQARFADVVKAAGNSADYVILDTAPLGVVSDALTLLELADDVILISKLRWTKRVHAEVTRDLLTRAGVEPTGLLVIGEGSHAPYPYYR